MSGVVKGLRTTSETYSARQTDVAGDSLQMMDNRSLSQEKETEDPTSQIYGHNILLTIIDFRTQCECCYSRELSSGAW